MTQRPIKPNVPPSFSFPWIPCSLVGSLPQQQHQNDGLIGMILYLLIVDFWGLIKPFAHEDWPAKGHKKDKFQQNFGSGPVLVHE